MEDKKFKLSDRDMLIEVVEFYIHILRHNICTQASIEAHEALLDRLENNEPQPDFRALCEELTLLLTTLTAVTRDHISSRGYDEMEAAIRRARVALGDSPSTPLGW